MSAPTGPGFYVAALSTPTASINTVCEHLCLSGLSLHSFSYLQRYSIYLISSSFINTLFIHDGCFESLGRTLPAQLYQFCSHHVRLTAGFELLAAGLIASIPTDDNCSDGAEHTAFRGINVKRATDNSTTDITLDEYEYVVVGSGPGGAPL